MNRYSPNAKRPPAGLPMWLSIVALVGLLAGPVAGQIDRASELLPATVGPDAEREERSQRQRRMLREALPTLDETVTLLDRHDKLPVSRWFGEDKQSNQSQIDDLLDEAIDTLGDSDLGEYRDLIRHYQFEVKRLNNELVELKKERLLAPSEASTSRLAKLNPLMATREDYEQAIAEDEALLKDYREEISRLRALFADALRAMGVNITDDAVDSLLATVSGDDFITMTIVFGNVKQLTGLLQTLTDESGEAPEQARRYYGMYVVSAQMLDRIQKQYVATIRQEHVPLLREYEKDAEAVIEEARRLIEINGGDSEILRSNMMANRMTIDAARNYASYLKSLAAAIEFQNKETERILATAINTYKTVSLSSNVAELIRSGSRNFDRIMKLTMPQLRAYDNADLRKEYQRLTSRMSESAGAK